MDKEHAKFILQSYRPDGADASNPDFTEALKCAAEDRDLGLWLAEERASDSVFVEALSTVDIPDGLRDEIFSVMEHDGGGEDLSSDLDTLFVSAMVHVSPPEGLRDQIISAMKVEQGNVVNEVINSKQIVRFPLKWFNLAAVAAVLVLGVTFIYSGFSGSEKSEHLRLSELRVESAKILNATYEIDVSNETLVGVNTWFEKEGMPVAETIPQGLISCGVRGGRRLLLDNGLQASMIFFGKKGAGEFYLMVLEASSLEDADKLVNISQVRLKNCKSCPVTHFNVTAWKDESKAYLLLSKSENKVIAELF